MFCAYYRWACIQIFFVKELWIQLGKVPLISTIGIKCITSLSSHVCLSNEILFVRQQTKSLSQHVQFYTSVCGKEDHVEIIWGVVQDGQSQKSSGRVPSTPLPFTCCFSGDGWNQSSCIWFEKGLSRWQANCYLSIQSTLLLKQFCQTYPSILTCLKMV